VPIVAQIAMVPAQISLVVIDVALMFISSRA
jgi:hypothetical protein